MQTNNVGFLLEARVTSVSRNTVLRYKLNWVLSWDTTAKSAK